ncbi:GNAT family N-acetyltransferase [bacterium]|nr:GNAT family N-acetyltransferase [bacterium]
MIIGFTYSVKSAPPQRLPLVSTDHPDDAEEELDSPETIREIADAIALLGHEVMLLGDGEQLVRRLLTGARPELVLNLAEGRGAWRCRESWVPALLESFGLPYTGSDALTMAATLDKDCAKRLVRAAGAATPQWVLVADDPAAVADDLARLPLPVILKPAYEGSSKGIGADSVITSRRRLPAAIRRVRRRYDQPVLVEEFVAGPDLTVGLVGNDPPHVLGIMQAIPTRAQADTFVYGLREKREYRQLMRYEAPAPLTPEDEAAVRAAALTCWQALGCRDVARIDFRLRDHVAHFIEANPLPGLKPVVSDLIILANRLGIEHVEVIAAILAAATTRLGLDRPETVSRGRACPHARSLSPPDARVGTRAPTRLRRLRKADIPALVRLSSDCRVFTPEEVETIGELLGESLTGEDYAVIVATVSRQPVGFAIFGPRPLTDRTYDLYWLAVDPACHGQGVGRKLLRRVEDETRRLGGRVLIIETSDTPSYAPARRLYERAGYEPYGHVPEFYGVGDGQVIYGKTL